MTLGIIGLGLMGGSLSLSLKHKRFFRKHIGYVKDPTHKKQIEELGLVDEMVELDFLIESSDVIVLAIPVTGIKELLPKLKGIKKDGVVIDLGGTKDEIVKSIPEEIRKNYVPAHPMCGTEYSGPTAAFRDLYRDSICVLCNLEDSNQRAIEVAEKIFLMMDMELHYMKADEHDIHA
ncbi:MAG: prephenate dehydrogenase/arogenate dehydrogenase family protein, partial [Campylobacterales bacterium]|nr:prephenate dehydrogenase/arogenate dehydrogenase family protein [Campylobacterales bacterium]